MTLTKAQREERDKALEDLRIALQPGETVYTILRHVARSGMTRWVDLYVMRDGEPWRITWSAAKATGYTYDTRRDALKVEGCGMDVGFEAVYSLARALWPDGFGCVGKGCPSNDHSNGDRDYTPHTRVTERGGIDTTTRSHWHQSGGYALNHRWM